MHLNFAYIKMNNKFANCLFGQMSIQSDVCSAKCLSAKCPSAICPGAPPPSPPSRVNNISATVWWNKQGKQNEYPQFVLVF